MPNETQLITPEGWNAVNYLYLNPDVDKAGVDPLLHWNLHGKIEGRKYLLDAPEGWNDDLYYQLNVDVRDAKAPALLHWLLWGKNEGRIYLLPEGWSSKYYLLFNPDVANAGVDPINHYGLWGRYEGRQYKIDAPEGWNAEYYLALNEDVATAGVDPLWHWYRNGQYEGRTYKIDPPMEWNGEIYLELYEDLRLANVNPLIHWTKSGKNEGRSYFKNELGEPEIPCEPPKDWKSEVYLQLNTDIAANNYWKDYPLTHYFSMGRKEGRLYLKKDGPIVRFKRLVECNQPLSGYFGICRVNGKMQFGTYGYQNGQHASKIFEYPHVKTADFNAESVFKILLFKGKYYCTLEHGQYSTVDRGMVYRLDGDKWVEVYRHPRWILLLETLVHTDGWLYVTGCHYNDRSDPAGVIRTNDGINWQTWFENPNEYRFFGMASKGNDIYIAGTSSGADWGANNCNPSIFCNSNLIWRDYSRPNDGFWACVNFKNEIYVGGSGHARVVRVSDRKTVLNIPEFDVIHSMIVDKKTDTLFAFANMNSDAYDTGATIYATKNGNDWYTIPGTSDVTSNHFGYYDDQEDQIWLASGRFNQQSKGYGAIFVSERE